MGLIAIGVGTCTLGRRTVDKDGKVVSETQAKWEYDPEGGSVAIVTLNPETMEPEGAAEVFGDWDAAHYLAEILKRLGTRRPKNIPNFKAILKKAMSDGGGEDFFCDYCEGYGYSCRECIVTEWIEDLGGK